MARAIPARAATWPAGVAALVTGVAAALRSRWGLVRHYWVVVNLVLTVVATVVLLLYMQTLTALSALARATPDDRWPVRTPSPLVHAVAALVVLLTATVLSIYKPSGITGLGRRR